MLNFTRLFMVGSDRRVRGVVFGVFLCCLGACSDPVQMQSIFDSSEGSYFLERTFGQPYREGPQLRFSPGLAVWMTADSPALRAPAKAVLEYCPDVALCPSSPAFGILRFTLLPSDDTTALPEVDVVPQFLHLQDMDTASVEVAVEELAVAAGQSTARAKIFASDFVAGQESIEVFPGDVIGRPATGDPTKHPGIPAIFDSSSRRVELMLTDTKGNYVDPFLFLSWLGDTAEQTPPVDSTPPSVTAEDIHLYPDGASSKDDEILPVSPGLFHVDGPVDLVTVIRDVGPPLCSLPTFAFQPAALVCDQPEGDAVSLGIQEISYEVHDADGLAVIGPKKARLYCLPEAWHTDGTSNDLHIEDIFHVRHTSSSLSDGLAYVPTNMRGRSANGCIPDEFLDATSAPDFGAIPMDCLPPGETYKLRVNAIDYAGMNTTSEVALFTTAAQDCPKVTLNKPETDFFTDISVESGVWKYSYDRSLEPNSGVQNDHSIVSFADLNGDGYDDIIMSSPVRSIGNPYHHVILENNQDGTFQDVSMISGLEDVEAAFLVFADVDNDDDQDALAIVDVQSNKREHIILQNNGNGTFAEKLRLKFPNDLQSVDLPRTSSAAGTAILADLNADGYLDIFIGNGRTLTDLKNQEYYDALYYGKSDAGFVAFSDEAKNRLNGGKQYLSSHKPMPSNGSIACDFNNDGDLDIFVATYGTANEERRGRNILWMNRNGKFVNEATLKGFAALSRGNPWSFRDTVGDDEAYPKEEEAVYTGSNGFGIDCADVNNDGLMDVFLSTISHPKPPVRDRRWSDSSHLLINQGKGAGYRLKDLVKTPADAKKLGIPFYEGDLNVAMIDFDNDGRLDISLVRDKKYESKYDGTEQKSWLGLMRQKSDQNFESLGYASGINGRNASLNASARNCKNNSSACDIGEECIHISDERSECRTACENSSDCSTPQEVCRAARKNIGGIQQRYCELLPAAKDARTLAWSDIDHDGDLDLLVGTFDSTNGGGRPSFLFRNEIGSENPWLAFRLRGDAKKGVNQDAIGSRVTIEYDCGRKLVREVRSSRGHYSSADSRVLHFGLGNFGCKYSVSVRWPDGVEVTFERAGSVRVVRPGLEDESYAGLEKIVENRYYRIEYPYSLHVQK